MEYEIQRKAFSFLIAVSMMHDQNIDTGLYTEIVVFNTNKNLPSKRHVVAKPYTFSRLTSAVPEVYPANKY